MSPKRGKNGVESIAEFHDLQRLLDPQAASLRI
jgi:hypothetical protein